MKMKGRAKMMRNTEVFYFKNAAATFSSFTHESEVVKF